MALVGVASAALAALPIEGRAQSRLEDQRQSLAALAAIAYYGVRLGVGWTTMKRFERKRRG